MRTISWLLLVFAAGASAQSLTREQIVSRLNGDLPNLPTVRPASGGMLTPAQCRKRSDTRRAEQGDSSRHWEGRTQVVDTTNFNSQAAFYGSDQNLHTIERFRRDHWRPDCLDQTVDHGISVRGDEWTDLRIRCYEANYAMGDVPGGASKAEGGTSRL